MECSVAREAHIDRISDLPCNVISNILERLPMCEAVRTSILSKKWRTHWVSVPCLLFDEQFFSVAFRGKESDTSIFESLVSKILLHHQGSIRKFSLHVPPGLNRMPDITPWMHCISRNSVREVSLVCCPSSPSPTIKLPAYFFHCVELVKLELWSCIFKLPHAFRGFRNLIRFEANWVAFVEDSLDRFIANCPLLEKVELFECEGVDNFVSPPQLKHLALRGTFRSLSLRKSQNLATVEILMSIPIGINQQGVQLSKLLVIDGFDRLCTAETLSLGGGICKFSAADGFGRLFPVTFNKMKKLSLSGVNFSSHLQVSFALRFIQNCPCIQEFNISADPWIDTNTAEQFFDYAWNSSNKLVNLQKVRFRFMTGLSSELKLTELLLACAPKLKTLNVICKIGIGSDEKIRILTMLNGFPRASSQAQVLYSNSNF